MELNPPTACSCWEVQAYPVPGRTKGFVTLYLSSFQGIHVQGMQFVDCLQMLAKGISRHTKVLSESLWFVNPPGLPRRASFSVHMGAPCRPEGPWFCNLKRQMADSFAARSSTTISSSQFSSLSGPLSPLSGRLIPCIFSHDPPPPALPNLIIDKVIQGQLPRSKVGTPFPSPLASVPVFLFG